MYVHTHEDNHYRGTVLITEQPVDHRRTILEPQMHNFGTSGVKLATTPLLLQGFRFDVLDQQRNLVAA